jgi:hypothetical protein
MTQVIPLAKVPYQTFSITLAGQRCRIALYQKAEGLFLDFSTGQTQIVTAMICRDRVKLLRYPYLGFIGNLAFIDTQGTSDPDYKSFGSRYVLSYLP